MPNKDYFMAVWFTDYKGIGYIRDSNGWNVFPIFTDYQNAKKLWEQEIEPLDERSLKMRFIELDEEYKFILYPYPFSKDRANFGFYRSIGSSETYKVFKQNFDGKALFRFGILGTANEPIVYHKSKLIMDVKFMKNTEVVKNSIEWIAEEVQKRLKAKERFDYVR